MIYDSLESSSNDDRYHEVIKIKPRISKIRIEHDEKENNNTNIPDKNSILISKDSMFKSNFTDNKCSSILSEKDNNRPNFQLSAILRSDFLTHDEDIPQDSLENQRNINPNCYTNEILSPKFQREVELNALDFHSENAHSLASPNFSSERQNKWKYNKSKSISNIYIVDHSSQNDFVSLYSKKSDQANDLSFKNFQKNDSNNGETEKDLLIYKLKEENNQYLQKLLGAEQVIFSLKNEIQQLINREKDYLFRIEDLTQKLEKIGLFSSRSQANLRSTNKSQFKDKELVIQNLQEEVEVLKRDNEHLRYIQEKILLNDKIENNVESNKESATLFLKQNNSFDCSSVNLYDTSTLKTYQDMTLPPLKESDLALSQIPREESREVKEIKKFIESLTNLVLELSPPGFYQGKPALKEIWKWLQNFLYQYMQLKKNYNSRDSVEYLLIAKQLVELQKFDELGKYLEEMLTTLTK